MSITFRPAVRENVGLIIGMIGPSGSGKTFSAMRLASGLSGGKPFAVIDTESRRALHYADQFKFDHGELHAPFRPDAYDEAIKAADKAGYPVIVVDSCSHEWAGEGGILDWQEEELDRMAGDDYRKREACKMAAWIKPKMSHKQMVQRLLQVRAHLILCFRAEEKSGMEKDKNGKTVIVQKGWQPICEKNMPYELTMAFLLTPEKPGVPQPIKLQEQHKVAIDLSKPVSEESGKKLAQWAVGGEVKREPKPEAPKPTPMPQEIKAKGAALRGEAPVKTISGDPAEGDLSEITQPVPDRPTQQQIGNVIHAFASKLNMNIDQINAEFEKWMAGEQPARKIEDWTNADLDEARQMFKAMMAHKQEVL